LVWEGVGVRGAVGVVAGVAEPEEAILVMEREVGLVVEVEVVAKGVMGVVAAEWEERGMKGRWPR
jgi:hypothetical protein